MAINNPYLPIKVITDGVLTTFAFNWSLTQAQDIKVYFEDSRGVKTLVDTGDYTLQRNTGENGGNIIFNTPPTTGQTLIIERLDEKTQEKEFSNTRTFNLKYFQDALDKLTRWCQEQDYGIGQAIKIPETAVSDEEDPIDIWNRIILSDTDESIKYAKIESGNLYVKSSTGSWIMMPKSSNIRQVRQRVENVDSAPVYIFEYTLNGTDWFNVADTSLYKQHKNLEGRDEADQHPASAITGVAEHIADTDNPHATTADQVGAYTKGETDDLLDNKADLSGATFTGDISATNLSGTNTGDQDLSGYAIDDEVVHLAGTETITGAKSFSEAITSTGGFKDADVSTAIKLGDSGNTVPTTGNKTIVGAINELNTKTSGGGVAPLPTYLTAVPSSIVGTYNQLNYVLPASEIILNATVNNNEALIKSFIYGIPLDTTTIPAGNWAFNVFTYVSATTLSTKLKIEIFTRTAGGVETTLFTVNSDDINLTSVGVVKLETFQNEFVVNTTDYLGARFYAITTAPIDITVYLYTGDGNPTYITTPLALRHDLLRDIKYVSDNKSGALHLTNGADTIYGVKTFNASPIVPTPTTDYQAATKKYVDDNAGGGGSGSSLSAGMSLFGLYEELPSAAYVWGDAGKQELNNASTNYSNLVDNITGGLIPSGTIAAWDAAYAANPDNAVPFWGYDSATDKVIVPNIPRGYAMTAAGSDVYNGTILQNAAPQHTHNILRTSNRGSFSAYSAQRGRTIDGGTDAGYYENTTATGNASDTSYGRDSTTRVRNDQIQMRVLFYVGAEVSPQEASQITAAGVLSDVASLNGLTGVGTATPMSDYVIETYVSGTTWYRLYKSGWVEQGGVVTTSTSDYSITLLVEMANADYSPNLTPYQATSTADVTIRMLPSSTATTLIVKTTANTSSIGFGVKWEVKGMAA